MGSVAGLQRLHVQPDGEVVIAEGDGSLVSSWNAPPGYWSNLNKNASGEFYRLYRDRTKLTFNSAGLLESVEDRFGPAARAVASAAKLGVAALYNNRRQSVGIVMSGWVWAQSGGQAFLGVYGGKVFAGVAGVRAGLAAGAEASLAITTMFEVGVGLGSAGGAAVSCL